LAFLAALLLQAFFSSSALPASRTLLCPLASCNKQTNKQANLVSVALFEENINKPSLNFVAARQYVTYGRENPAIQTFNSQPGKLSNIILPNFQLNAGCSNHFLIDSYWDWQLMVESTMVVSKAQTFPTEKGLEWNLSAMPPVLG